MAKKLREDKSSTHIQVAYKRKFGTLYVADSQVALCDPALTHGTSQQHKAIS